MLSFLFKKNKKFFLKLSTLILIVFLIIPVIPPTKKANATTGYPVPHTITMNLVSVANGNFLPLGQATPGSVNSTESLNQVYMFRDGTWSGLSVYVRAANNSGDVTLTVRKNGVDTSLAVTIPQSTTGRFQDTSNSVSVAVGDLMSIGVTTTGGTIDPISITALFESDNGDSVQYFVATSGGGFSSSPRYIRPVAPTAPNNITVEANAANKILHDATIVGLQVHVSSNTRTGTSNFNTRVNASTGFTRSVSSAATGNFTSTGSQSMSAGDTFNTSFSFSGGSGTVRPALITLCVVSSNPREITLLGSNVINRGTTGTTSAWGYTGGLLVMSGASETIARTYLTTPGILSNMAFYVSANTSNQNLDLVLRKNGSDGNQTITYSSGTGWFEDTSNTDTVISTNYVSIRSARAAVGTGTTTFQHQAIKYTMDEILPTYDQSAYRFFQNNNSTNVGSALANQDTPATLATAGDAFRLRLLINIYTNKLNTNGENFKLQYVGKGSGSCASPSGGTPASYTDITGSTLIAYNNNATPSDGSALTPNANDPINGSNTIVNQTYEESNNFTNSQSEILSGQDGKWDFSLIDNGATPGTTYCIRAVKSDGSVLENYGVYPEITTAAASGSLSVDIVDSGGTPVGSPTVSMSPISFSFTHQTATGSFGVSSQKIRVDNGTGIATWTLSLAADDGPTAFWNGTIRDYDFNDPTANAEDGGDADSLGGQMTINPGTATITPEGGCSLTNISAGSNSAFNQGTTDSITLASAASGADTNCYWDITGIGISQTIPKEQPADTSYNINMTLSIIAS